MKNLTLLLFLFASHAMGWSQYYEFSLHNEEQHGQKIIKTKDGGFLLVASKSCYTPGSVVIEGCPRGTYLIKLDSNGDSLWTSQISPDLFHHPYIFENADGTFTLISSDHENYSCGQISVSLWGFSRIITVTVSALGELLSYASYPDDCELSLQSALRLTDNRFAVLATYNEIINWDYYENRLYIMDKNLTIHDSIILFDGRMRFNQFFLNNNNEIVLIYSNPDSIITMNIYDQQLNLLRSHTNEDLKQTCFAGYSTDHAIIEPGNGTMISMCSDRINGSYVGGLALFNDQLDLLAYKSINLFGAKEMIAVNQDRVAIVSQNVDLTDDVDIQLTYYSTTSVDSLEATIIRRPGMHRPTDIVLFQNDKIAITGNVNCCSQPDTIGPSDSFLYLGDLSTSLEKISYPDDDNFLYPNPANDVVNVILENNIIKNNNNLMIEIFTTTGSFINKTAINGVSTEVYLHPLSTGIYIVILKSENKILSRTRLTKINF